MQRVCGLILLAVVSLSYATSPPFPTPTPLDCNATDSEAGLILDLINEVRDEGFLFEPLRVVRRFKSWTLSLFFLTVDVLETKCSVLSGKSWRNCTESSSFHERVFGRCKAVTYIDRPQRILKILHYNCTLSPVPAAVIVRMCPDCPTFGGVITAQHIALADQLVAKYNKESNNTNYFKTYHVERQSAQWVFGPSRFIKFTIKESECHKTQEDVVLSNCNFLPDKDAGLGFCKGNIYTHPNEGEKMFISCELYGPKVCIYSPPEQQGADHKPERSHKHHRHGCRPHHHNHHHPHHHGHQDHHQHRPHHHQHHHHHHDHVNGHNHTSAEKHGSSSEEHKDKKHRHFNKPIGSVEIIILTENDVLPEPDIAHRIPDKDHPNVYEFPDSKSPLATCPGEPKEKSPLILKYFPQEVHNNLKNTVCLK
uniref:Cystatin domain-containing protein n=1 Tax=Leptobrachium leishanense TaxID=445787 RepID=A0A8C5MCD1_9ANUR